jgi:hypothetical protein
MSSFTDKFRINRQGRTAIRISDPEDIVGYNVIIYKTNGTIKNANGTNKQSEKPIMFIEKHSISKIELADDDKDLIRESMNDETKIAKFNKKFLVVSTGKPPNTKTYNSDQFEDLLSASSKNMVPSSVPVDYSASRREIEPHASSEIEPDASSVIGSSASSSVPRELEDDESRSVIPSVSRRVLPISAGGGNKKQNIKLSQHNNKITHKSHKKPKSKSTLRCYFSPLHTD